MSKVAFWNIQRNSDLLSQFHYWPMLCDYYLACEALQSQSTSDEDEIDFLKRDRQSSRRNAMQLGYQSLLRTGTNLVAYEVTNYDKLTGTDFWLTKGNAFMPHSIRHVAEVEDPDGSLSFPCYFYHSNSSSKGAAMTAWVASDLCEQVGEFALMGDFNCEPDALIDTLTYIYCTTDRHILQGAMVGLQVVYHRPTHNAKHDDGATKVYDYLVNKGSPRVVETLDAQGASDHHPILVQDGVVFNGTRMEKRGQRSWKTWWKRVHNFNHCVAWELVGDG